MHIKTPLMPFNVMIMLCKSVFVVRLELWMIQLISLKLCFTVAVIPIFTVTTAHPYLDFKTFFCVKLLLLCTCALE